MILAVSSQKGGTGKSTTSQTLAAGLNRQKKKTLLIDLDPQCNLSYSCGIDPESALVTVADLLEKRTAAADAVIHTAEGNIICGDYSLKDADVRYTETGREYRLSDALEPLKRKYAYIVIDCPPTIGILTVNALTACDQVLIPLTASVFSVQGLGQLYPAIMSIKRYCNKNLAINGLLLTRYRKTNVSSQTKNAILSIAEQMKTRVYETVIREQIAVSEAQTERRSLFTAAPKSGVAMDYAAFISEFLKEERRNAKKEI